MKNTNTALDWRYQYLATSFQLRNKHSVVWTPGDTLHAPVLTHAVTRVHVSNRK